MYSKVSCIIIQKISIDLTVHCNDITVSKGEIDMTIKEFANLCECNPQTLRYYDSIDLLKPVKVDPWTGYRYYDEAQGETYVKIKNLQKAGFTIDEIRQLLDQDDRAIYDAFEKKVKEAEERLREIKLIRQSYQSEMSTIQSRIQGMKDRILSDAKKYDPVEEFGLSNEEYEKILSQIEQCLDTAVNSIDDNPVLREVAEKIPPEIFDKIPTEVLDKISDMQKMKPTLPAFREDPNYHLIYEKHGWENVKDFLAEFEKLEPGSHALDFQVVEEKYENTIAFSGTLLNLLLMRNPGIPKNLVCNVDPSKDGQNHFWLYRKNA